MNEPQTLAGLLAKPAELLDIEVERRIFRDDLLPRSEYEVGTALFRPLSKKRGLDGWMQRDEYDLPNFRQIRGDGRWQTICRFLAEIYPPPSHCSGREQIEVPADVEADVQLCLAHLVQTGEGPSPHCITAYPFPSGR